MKTISAVTSLSALAQSSRLAIFRALVQAGASGLSAGKISAVTNIAPSSITKYYQMLQC